MNEFSSLFWISEACIRIRYVYIIFNTSQTTQFCFYYYAVSVCIFNNLFSNAYVFVKIMVRSVNHYGSETAVYTVFTNFEGIAVIKVKSDWQIAVFKSCFHKFNKVNMFCIFTSACRYLQDKRGLFLFSSVYDTLYDFHVIYVESADSVATFVGFFKHFCSSN